MKARVLTQTLILRLPSHHINCFICNAAAKREHPCLVGLGQTLVYLELSEIGIKNKNKKINNNNDNNKPLVEQNIKIRPVAFLFLFFLANVMQQIPLLHIKINVFQLTIRKSVCVSTE